METSGGKAVGRTGAVLAPDPFGSTALGDMGSEGDGDERAASATEVTFTPSSGDRFSSGSLRLSDFEL
jgi:hypothetical protein